jgi:ParB family transcriptional regulator, chromosome partitioning protein
VSKERRLGRGLEALLGRSYADPQRTDHLALHVPSDDPTAEAGASTNASSESAGNGQLAISVHDIQRNPFQPRREFDEQEIAALADSLTEHGLIQPILVRRVGERYQLIAGERRLRAAVKAGWMEVPVQVRDADDRQVAELAIVENLQRKDLNPLEKAASFEQYIERYQCTQEELAGRLNIDRSTIANLIRLLELPTTVQSAIRSGAVSQGHARALLPLGDEREQIAFCERIQAEGLSVRATEQLVHEQIHSTEANVPVAGKTSRSSRGRGQNLAALEQEFRESLGTKVSIRETAKGRGKIVIQFSTREEFDRLRSLLSNPGPAAMSRAS